MDTSTASTESSILRLHYSDRNDLLSLLKIKPDQSLYIEMIDASLGVTQHTFELPNTFYDPHIISRIYDHLDLQNSNYSILNPRYELPDAFGFQKFFNMGQPLPADLSIWDAVYSFEVNHEQCCVLLQVAYLPAEEPDKTKEVNRHCLLVFDFEGLLVYRDLLNYKPGARDRHYPEFRAQFLDENTLMWIYSVQDTGYRKVKLWGLTDGRKAAIDILDSHSDEDDDEDDVIDYDECPHYEYMEGYSVNHQRGLLAMLLCNPTWGEDAIKLLKLSSNLELEAIYNYSENYNEDKYTLNNIVLHPSGEEMAVLAFHTGYAPGTAREMNFRVFSISDNQKPVRTFRITYLDTYKIVRMQYLNADHLCVVMLDKIIIYDMNNGDLKIALDRDSESLFYVSESRVFYTLNSQLCTFYYQDGITYQGAVGSAKPYSKSMKDRLSDWLRQHL